MKKVLTLFAAVMVMMGCYPSGPDYAEQLDLVLTNYDPEFDFASRQTYSLPDRVPIISDEDIDDPDGNDEPDFVDPATATLILNGIRTNMNNLGYTEVDESQSPDLILLASAMSTTTLIYYYDWWYWGGYYPGYPGYGWGWYYPGYYPPVFTSYTTGTLFIQLTDPNGQTPTGNIPVPWVGVANGLLDTGNEASRIQSSIDQMFSQSSYL
jgi:hypothetical protein